MSACMKLFAYFFNPHALVASAGSFQREGERGDIDSTGSYTISRYSLTEEGRWVDVTRMEEVDTDS